MAEALNASDARSGASPEHHDALRAIGLHHARGQTVSMIEDHGVPTDGWCRGLLAALENHPGAGAVGGAIACGSDRLLNRAVCYMDFWRYQAPLPEGRSYYASDANIAYRRAALVAIQDAWDPIYHETVVHRALLERSYEMWLTPGATVLQTRGKLGWKKVLLERFVSGRSFAGTRVRGGIFPEKGDVRRLLPSFAATDDLKDGACCSRARRILE